LRGARKSGDFPVGFGFANVGTAMSSTHSVSHSIVRWTVRASFVLVAIAWTVGSAAAQVSTMKAYAQDAPPVTHVPGTP
jgi:hypothetical protein